MKALVPLGILLVVTFALLNALLSHSITRITGTVSAVSPVSITLIDVPDFPGGLTVSLDRSTLFLQDGKAVSWRGVNVGAEADVDAAVFGDSLSAINVSFENQSPRQARARRIVSYADSRHQESNDFPLASAQRP